MIYIHVVIYNDSWEEHLKTLKELFGRLRRARITARPKKCFLEADRMEFLGHQIRGDVITPSSDNLEMVWKTPCPTTKKQVRPFLGLVGYYRDHIPTFAEKLSLAEANIVPNHRERVPGSSVGY